MLVRDLLTSKKRDIITTTAETGIDEAMGLLIDNAISCLPVLSSKGRLDGIVSDKDIFRLIFEHRTDFKNYKVKDVMTSDLLVGLPGDDVNYVAGMMMKNRIRHIPIVERDKLLGLVSQSDIVKTRIKRMAVENRYLKLYFDGDYPG
ncbi:MAG: CBS domain-containing protein [candidate division Zixibacteria bacterium]|nr:CBS domain-containing protein [candidate division Zixibacteria bacterium]MDH3939019.1 CBS domain-containing protein [candidate division Zixibacteria bacterium]MDH4035380.1 CBS domain-containing protein [candidate division Zixibacteria bacterium]